MKVRVWDEEEKKEAIVKGDPKIFGEVGKVCKVTLRKNGKNEIHHYKVLEILPPE